jgi:sterol desaturase/sphingolipid hydroxylase (fatty acid hydroxylase superfamily)
MLQRKSIFGASMGTAREQLLILITTPIYLVVIGLELFLSKLQKQETYTIKDTAQNIYFMVLNGLIDLAFRIIYIGFILTFFYDQRMVSPIQNPWIYWLALVLFEDFMYYWLHRVDHYCRLFWATHVTHHSSEKFNFTVGFRSSVLEPLYRFIYFIPIAWLGFQPIDIAFIYAATQTWGILVHTEKIKKAGWLEYIFVTPSHHRVHHGSNAKYLDKNLGMFLIIWDKIFGTFQRELPAEQYQPIRYGLTQPLEKQDPVNIVVHEWKSIGKDLRKKGLSIRQRLNYLVGPPGWSHDGSRLTSKELRRKEEETKVKTLSEKVESMQIKEMAS